MEGVMYLPPIHGEVSGSDYGAEAVTYSPYGPAAWNQHHDTTTDRTYRMEKHLNGLEKSVKGHGYEGHLVLENPYPDFSALNLNTSIKSESHFDDYRTVRYVSPGGPLGGDLTAASDTGSSPAEDWSPQFHFNQVNRNSTTSSPQNWTASSSHDMAFPRRSFWTADLDQPHPSHQSGAYPQGAVIPQETQHFPDPNPEPIPYDNADSIRLTSQPPQHLKLLTTQPSSSAETSDDDDSAMQDQDDAKDTDYLPSSSSRRRASANTSRSPTLSRRGNSRRTTLPTEPSTRISKPTTSPTAKRKSKGRKSTATPTSSATIPLTPPPRPFICPFAMYGCPSTFTAKNEWKRHISSQHLQLGFYRCDIGACNPDNHPSASPYSTSRTHNDFNRKDLFTQHLRRMHRRNGVEKADFERELEGVRGRCWVRRRDGPMGVQCEGCGRVSSGWEDWVECLGGHVEKDGFKISVGEYGTALKDWAIREGVVGETEHGRLALWGSKGLGSGGVGLVGGDEDAEGEDE